MNAGLNYRPDSAEIRLRLCSPRLSTSLVVQVFGAVKNSAVYFEHRAKLHATVFNFIDVPKVKISDV